MNDLDKFYGFVINVSMSNRRDIQTVFALRSAYLNVVIIIIKW